jgi:hypothetical protein
MANSRRLTAKQLTEWRTRTAAEQKLLCALCGEPFTVANPAVADHDHVSGVLRAVLHRGCNSMLGVLENGRARYQLRSDVRFAKFLSSIQQYLWRQYGEDRPLYPTFRTTEEKKALAKRRSIKRKVNKLD